MVGVYLEQIGVWYSLNPAYPEASCQQQPKFLNLFIKIKIKKLQAHLLGKILLKFLNILWVFRNNYPLCS